MRLRDLLLLSAICFVWALNLIVSRWLFTDHAVPPIFYAAVRFVLVALILSPLLRPLPRPLSPILLIGVLLGAGHFGLMFLALANASSSSVSIVLQMSIPVTAILSVLLLGERIGLGRGLGIGLALGGVVLVIWDGEGLGMNLGLVLGFVSAVVVALGSVLLKRYGAIRPLTMQAWVALVSAPPLLAYSLLVEPAPVETSLAAGWPFWAGLAFSTFAVTIAATTLFFWVLQRYPASIVAPLGLMMPLMAVAMGIVLLGETFELRTALGGVIALAGLLLVLRQPIPRDDAAPREMS